MELEDLKQTWKETTIIKNKNTDIMDIMKHKSYGPIAALKREFRKQIVAMASGLILYFVWEWSFSLWPIIT